MSRSSHYLPRLSFYHRDCNSECCPSLLRSNSSHLRPTYIHLRNNEIKKTCWRRRLVLQETISWGWGRDNHFCSSALPVLYRLLNPITHYRNSVSGRKAVGHRISHHSALCRETFSVISSNLFQMRFYFTWPTWKGGRCVFQHPWVAPSLSSTPRNQLGALTWV